jgi:hypothetical protein
VLQSDYKENLIMLIKIFALSVSSTSPAVGTTGVRCLVEDGISIFISAPKQAVVSTNTVPGDWVKTGGACS